MENLNTGRNWPLGQTLDKLGLGLQIYFGLLSDTLTRK